MKRLFSSIVTLALAGGLVGTFGGAASAKPCHDAKGKFVKCPSTMAAPMTNKRCRDAKGKFMKCRDTMAMPKKM
ncbi:MAG: hypothetical protein NVSMB19_19540 [Vulcanimicrobiaceae bacterium]